MPRIEAKLAPEHQKLVSALTEARVTYRSCRALVEQAKDDLAAARESCVKASEAIAKARANLSAFNSAQAKRRAEKAALLKKAGF